ncbi:hypothetical protein BDZ94DRAFT_1319363 [Collybia nuda]|uniref:DUF6533 domain-containing protein n=1 Tax=Collybia nuda TaxID=64659 RepID=A0A9P6CNA1_9AGAR|nr:hypothetical protein BDZ94DRAFT_1319363 [Collybia nuda]
MHMLDVVASSSIQSQLNNSNYINLVAFVILYYDYALTLPDEVERFWATRSLTWASSFFYINRYLTLLGHIPVMVQYYWDARRSADVCPSLASFHQYLAVFIQVVVGILLIMRTYALYDQNIWVLLFICAAGLAVIVFGTYSVVANSRGNALKENLPAVGCVPPINMTDANRLAAAWTGLLLFDVLIFVMTVYKSTKRSRGGDRTLINILLRDGAIYFGIMSAVGLANILTFHLSPEYERGFITTFANIISSTMISRLMLNLRDRRLYPRYRVKAMARGTLNRATNVPVLSTVFEFNTMQTSITTNNNWLSTHMTGDPEVATDSIEIVSRTSTVLN